MASDSELSLYPVDHNRTILNYKWLKLTITNLFQNENLESAKNKEFINKFKLQLKLKKKMSEQINCTKTK